MVVSILPETYSNYNSGCTAYRSAVKRLGYPIAVRLIKGDVYLIRIKNPKWTARDLKRMCSSCSSRFPSKECATCENLSNYRE